MHERLTHKSLEALAKAVQQGTLTQEEISRATGVHQSQVSRILAGQAKRQSPNVLRLQRFSDERERRPRPRNEKLEAAFSALWDGTAEHEAALLDIVASLRRIHAATRGRS